MEQAEKTDLERLADSIIQADWSISDDALFRLTVICFARKYLSDDIREYVEKWRERDAERHAKMFAILRDAFSEQADRRVASSKRRYDG